MSLKFELLNHHNRSTVAIEDTSDVDRTLFEMTLWPSLKVPVINFWYPSHDELTYLEVGLDAVRAADSIRIHYDFERDGYSIEQASVFSWDADDTEGDSDWQEVAFVRAWARERERERESEVGK